LPPSVATPTLLSLNVISVPVVVARIVVRHRSDSGIAPFLLETVGAASVFAVVSPTVFSDFP
jgi:hypothetical protein